MKKSYRTNRKKWTDGLRSPAGWLSMILGAASILIFPVTVRMSYLQEGLGTMMIGALGLFAFLFAVTGFILPKIGRKEDENVPRIAKAGGLVSGLGAILWIVIFVYGFLI